MEGDFVINNIFAGIFALLFWLSIILSINSLFPMNPWILLIYEIIFGVIAIILGYIIRNRWEIHNEKYCNHRNIKEDCSVCKEELRLRTIEWEKQRLQREADDFSRSEGIRLRDLKFKKSSTLLELTPNEFEDSIAKLFTSLGYSVTQTPYVNDGGKDAVAFKDGKKYLIECKRYAVDKPIGRPMLQKFHSALVEENAVKGFFVTTSYFASTAFEYANKYNIELINGNDLITLYQKAYPESQSNMDFEQMCRVCGSLVQFSINNEQDEKLCKNGHNVVRRMPFIPSIASKPSRKRRYRRY